MEAGQVRRRDIAAAGQQHDMIIRLMSAAFRGRVDDSTGAATLADARVQELRAAIRVVEPPSPYALGTKDAPLLLTVANGLPIGVRVRIDLASSGGLVVGGAWTGSATVRMCPFFGPACSAITLSSSASSSPRPTSGGAMRTE